MNDPLTKQWWDESVSEWVRIKEEAGVSKSAAEELDRPRDPKLPAEVFRSQEIMYWAARNGDWSAARAFIDEHPEALTAKVTMTGMTALHVAAAAGHAQFVKRLIEKMNPEDLAVGDNDQDTPFHYAVMEGKLEVARILHNRNTNLVDSRGFKGNLPINTAVLGRPKAETKELLRFLVSETKEPFAGDDKDSYLLARLTLLSYHDITRTLLDRRKQMATAKDGDGKTLLDFLVRLPGDFPSGAKLAFWETWIYNLAPLRGTQPRSVEDDEEANLGKSTQSKSSYPWKLKAYQKNFAWSVINTLVPGPCQRLLDLKRTHDSALILLRFVLEQATGLNKPELSEFFTSGFVTKAARDGIIEVVKECLAVIPYESMGADKKTRLSPIDEALTHRQGKVVVVIYKALNELTDKPTPNSLWVKKRVTNFRSLISSGLHVVAKLAPVRTLKRVSSPALQMQSEIQWYQELEKRADPVSKDLPNMEGKTAREVFTEEHKDLLEKAEDWMKNMASYNMLTATLIAAVAFAAAYTLPGGNNQDTGIPIFLRRMEFKVFLVSDAIALSSSIASLLIFLSIMTSRFAEEDFVRKLPRKLIVALAFLFTALATMISAFVFSIWLVVNDTFRWISILSTVLSAIPVLLFLSLQLPIFFDMYESTFGRGFIDLSTVDE